MTTTIVTITLALAMGGTGQCPDPARCPYGQQHHHHEPRRAPAAGSSPTGPATAGASPTATRTATAGTTRPPSFPWERNRTDSYYFPRYFAIPPEQAFMGTYYNPYVMRGQRYLPYTGNGGCHPMGGPPPDTAVTSVRPYSSLTNNRPVTRVPRLNGRVEAPVENSGKTGLTP